MRQAVNLYRNPSLHRDISHFVQCGVVAACRDPGMMLEEPCRTLSNIQLQGEANENHWGNSVESDGGLTDVADKRLTRLEKQHYRDACYATTRVVAISRHRGPARRPAQILRHAPLPHDSVIGRSTCTARNEPTKPRECAIYLPSWNESVGPWTWSHRWVNHQP